MRHAGLWRERSERPRKPSPLPDGPELHRHLGIRLDPVLIDAIAHYTDFLRDWGFLAGDFDLNAWVDRRAFDTLDTRAVA